MLFTMVVRKFRLPRLRLRVLAGALFVLLCVAFFTLRHSDLPQITPDGQRSILERFGIKFRHLANNNSSTAGKQVHLHLSKNVQVASTEADISKRDKVLEMIKHAWKGYERYAWGINQVRPFSKSPDFTERYYGSHFGITIIDSLDTLYIAGLKDEFEKAKLWVQKNFTFSGSYTVGVFETNIRFVGGFLSAYALTNNKIFLKQATSIARKLLHAFDTQTGLPRARINLATSETSNWQWTPGGCAILAEIGSMSMEFLYLANVTGDHVFRNKIENVIRKLKWTSKDSGLYSNFISSETGHWCQKESSVGAFGDSFYEYLFKSWLLTSHHEADMKAMYDEAIEAALRHLLQTSKTGKKYFAGSHGWKLNNRMEHFACFMGGLLALSAKHSNDAGKYLQIADAIGETCHFSYNSTATGLGPDAFSFANEAAEAVAVNSNDRAYYLRPEAVETYFYMWRLTREPKWRQYAWEVVEAIEKHCRCEGGYSGVTDVYAVPAHLDDIQQSYFLAETLKYLYLLFSSDDIMPLDQYVFNTEGHPLPVFDPSIAASTTKPQFIKRQPFK